jgi:hypothetical protein
MTRVQELFGLALRILGAVVLYYGLSGLLDAALFNLGYFNYPDSSPNYYLISGLFQLVVGIYLLRGAPGLVRFAYPASEDEDDDEEDSEEEKSAGSE